MSCLGKSRLFIVVLLASSSLGRWKSLRVRLLTKIYHLFELSVASYSVIVDDSEMRKVMKTIRALRREQGWTQFELALRVGVQPQAVYLWESGRRMPQVPQMR